MHHTQQKIQERKEEIGEGALKNGTECKGDEGRQMEDEGKREEVEVSKKGEKEEEDEQKDRRVE